MARAKNTSRAEARKRTRDAQRAELAALEDEQLDDQAAAAAAPAPRPATFKMPNFREDIRALPSVFRTRRLVWLPFGMVLVGFVLALLIYGMPAELQNWVALYLQLFFVPQGLFAYFIAGWFAPRASYLVGGLAGLMSGALYGTALVATLPAGADIVLSDAAASVASYTVSGVVLGTFAGGFAAWYRDFLRGMRERGMQQRAEREAKERAKRRAERQEARRIIKQRPTA